MLKKLAFIVVLLAALGVAVPASAEPVIDFRTGNVGTGGSLFLFGDGNLYGAGIPISNVLITGVPGGEQLYDVAGTGLPGTWTGVLNFRTGGEAGVNMIEIVGCIVGLAGFACDEETVLLSGTISGFDINNGKQGLVSAWGIDVKNAAMLEALGIAANTPWAFFGFSLATSALVPCVPDVFNQVCSPGTAISTDIRNTAVPEPGSMLLLGSGLIGLAAAARRRSRSKK